MTGWRSRPMVGFDLETDSPLPDEAHIVSACVGIAGPGGWTPRNWLLKPDRPIAEEAAAIHGITTEYATEHGTDRREGLAEIRSALMNAWAQGWPVVAFNATYDFTVLDRELRRNGMPELIIGGPVIDVFVLDKRADPYRKGSRKLTAVAAHHGVILSESDAHGAEADALAACRIAWKIGAGWLDLQHLHDEQVVAYREQRESFARYLAKKGERLDDPNTIWPLKPYPAAAAA